MNNPSTSFQETHIYLDEKDLKNNTKEVFGIDCPFFGKILYLFMSKGFDRAKISLARFLECLYPLYDDANRMNQNKIAFKIMDIDRDNSLNIINLLHLQKNFHATSKMGIEIYKIMEYQIQKNLHNKNSFRHEKINYDIFHKVVGPSCIIKEIRECIFGSNLEHTPGGIHCPTPKGEKTPALRERGRKKLKEDVHVMRATTSCFA